jgi:hypothetical protein
MDISFIIQPLCAQIEFRTVRPAEKPGRRILFSPAIFDRLEFVLEYITHAESLLAEAGMACKNGLL